MYVEKRCIALWCIMMNDIDGVFELLRAPIFSENCTMYTTPLFGRQLSVSKELEAVSHISNKKKGMTISSL